MLKKMLLIATLVGSFLYADYYTSTDSSLTLPKKLIFDDQLTLQVLDSGVQVNREKQLHWISYEPNRAKKYTNVSLQDKNAIIQSYSVYNYDYLLKNEVTDKLFMLKIAQGFLLVTTKMKEDTLSLVSSQDDVHVNAYQYKVIRAFNNHFKDVKVRKKYILTKYMDDAQNLVAIDILDNGVKKLLKSITPQLTHFLQEKKKRAVVVKNADFSKEKLYLTYVSKKESSQKRMNITYEMIKKNIKTVLKAPQSFFDPDYKGLAILTHIGFMRDTGNDLFEMKKVEIVNEKIDLEWVNNPRKSFVVLKYMNAGVPDSKVLSKSRGQQFYAMEGVLYLVTWMQKNGVTNKVVTFVNGSMPFDVTMVQTTPNVYKMQKESQTIYTFKTGKDNLVHTILYPAYDIKIDLEQVDNDTTLKNKAFLASYKNDNNIKRIKE